MFCSILVLIFLQKTGDIRSHIVPGSYDPSVTYTLSAVFDQWTPISLQPLAEIDGQLKPTNFGHDVIPSSLVEQTFYIVGPSILTLINISFKTAVVTISFKHDIVQLIQ